MELIGYFLAVLVGITLGLIGSGGAILTIPVLVYIMGINPILATTYSLFIVGITSFVGFIKRAKEKNIDFKTAIIFSIPSILVVYVVRNLLLPKLPDIFFEFDTIILTKSVALMIMLATVMVAASISMIKSGNKKEVIQSDLNQNFSVILIQSIIVGLVTGFVGAGGGFLIIPSLVFVTKLPMKKAIGTSLIIITMNSMIGFISSFKTNFSIDWNLLILFTSFSITGIFIGILLSKKIPGEKLKSVFGWFVLIMGIYIILNEVFLQ